ncbi:MAG: hypothetical protein U1D97_03720 [Desulfuromonadales bacterium]|nr:hypothetical protein [Desulfuromonadales bacterium]
MAEQSLNIKAICLILQETVGLAQPVLWKYHKQATQGGVDFKSGNAARREVISLGLFIFFHIPIATPWRSRRAMPPHPDRPGGAASFFKDRRTNH